MLNLGNAQRLKYSAGWQDRPFDRPQVATLPPGWLGHASQPAAAAATTSRCCRGRRRRPSPCCCCCCCCRRKSSFFMKATTDLGPIPTELFGNFPKAKKTRLLDALLNVSKLNLFTFMRFESPVGMKRAARPDDPVEYYSPR